MNTGSSEQPLNSVDFPKTEPENQPQESPPELRLVDDDGDENVSGNEEEIGRWELTMESISDIKDDLSRRKSPEVARYFLQKITQVLTEMSQAPSLEMDRDSIDALYEEIERIPDLAEVQESALRALEEMGVISYSPEGLIIADLDRVRNLKAEENIQKLQTIHNSKFYGGKVAVRTLYYTFKNLSVISGEDYEKGAREGKPLFYSPSTAEEAFGVETIKQADFYIGQWEAAGRVSSDHVYPSTEDEANFAEVSLACNIYHPEYGNGYRDEDGRLFVYDQEREEHRPLSGERIFRGSQGIAAEAYSQPARYVETNFPNLNLRGLLVPEDFKVLPAQRIESPYAVKRSVDSNGGVMIDKIQYYIGKQEEIRRSDVYQISDDFAVLCHDGKVTHTFALRDIDDPDLMVQSGPDGEEGYKRIGKEGTGLTPYNHEQFAERSQEESEEDYQRRVDALNNFDIWLKLDDLLGEKGLIFFRQMEFDPETAKILLSAEDRLGEESITEIVDTYQKITRSVREIGNFMRDNLGTMDRGNETAQNVVHRLMEKTLKLLLEYIEEPPSIEQIKSEMTDLQSEVSIFAATFKEAKTEDGVVDMEDFQKFKVEASHGSQIDQESQDKMKQMLTANRMDRPDIIEQASKEFEEALSNPQSTFYILKYDDEIVGFFRMDREGELDARLGSLNIPPKLQGTGIGDETLKRYIEVALNGRIGHASADPRNPITPSYIGRYNFVGESIETYGDSQRPYIEMRLDQALNSRLKYFQAEDDEIVSEYEGNDYQIGQEHIILRFPSNELDKLMEKSEGILSAGQYVMSAFRKVENSNEDNVLYAVYEKKPGQNE